MRMMTAGPVVSPDSRKQFASNKKNVCIYLSKIGRESKKKLAPQGIESDNVGVECIPAANIQITRKTLLAMIENSARDEQVPEEPCRRKTNASASWSPILENKVARKKPKKAPSDGPLRKRKSASKS